MNRISRRCFCVGLLISVASSSMASPEATLKECQALKDKIEQYDQLRRQGGSGSQMDAWKRARRASEKKYRDIGCRYRRWQLK